MRLRSWTIVLPALLLSSFIAVSQETVQEPSTGISFPVSVTFSSGGKDLTLCLTGVAVRKKMIFKVYGMGHYMQDPPRDKGNAVFNEILTDGKAKQITMVFVRDVDAASVQKAYLDGFKENSTEEELAAIQPFIDKFLTSFTGGVKENDTFLLRWLPGGSVNLVVHGEEKPAVTNTTFARVLWAFWLGKDSIVDRDDLVARLGGK
jgi:hypothetical protein